MVQVTETLNSTVEGIIGSAVDETSQFMAEGLDSLGAVELRTAVQSRLGVELPATVAFDYPSVQVHICATLALFNYSNFCMCHGTLLVMYE